MCGFRVATHRYTYGKRLPWFVFTSLYLVGHVLAKTYRPRILTIYNGGSFLNDDEIPLQAQLKICEAVSRDKTIEKLFVESRPEFITSQKIAMLSEILRNKRLRIGIGLECQNDFIRTHCIHKGFLRTDYERAYRILKQYRVELLTYILIKPLFLTEKEAIDEAIATARYAFRVGSDEVAFQAAFVQEQTKMEKLYKLGKYRPPWLWSVIEILQKTYPMGPFTLGMFEDDPTPIAIPKNCDKCSPLIYSLLKEFNKNHNIDLFDGLQCECRHDWEVQLSSKTTRLGTKSAY